MKKDKKLFWLIMLLQVAIIFFKYVIDDSNESEPEQSNVKENGSIIKKKISPSKTQTMEETIEQGFEEYNSHNNTEY